jgi:hypothetical protein
MPQRVPDDEAFYGDSRRYYVCHLLADKGIPFMVWLTEVVTYYRHGRLSGSEHVDLLVHDLDQAADLLLASGCKEIPRDTDDGVPYIETTEPQRELTFDPLSITDMSLLKYGAPSELEDTKPPVDVEEGKNIPLQSDLKVNLYLDKTWGLNLTAESPLIPSLPLFIDTMAAEFLSGDLLESSSYLDEVYYKEVKLPAIDELEPQLKPEHRQFHRAALAAGGIRSLDDHDRCIVSPCVHASAAPDALEKYEAMMRKRARDASP